MNKETDASLPISQKLLEPPTRRAFLVSVIAVLGSGVAVAACGLPKGIERHPTGGSLNALQQTRLMLADLAGEAAKKDEAGGILRELDTAYKFLQRAVDRYHWRQDKGSPILFNLTRQKFGNMDIAAIAASSGKSEKELLESKIFFLDDYSFMSRGLAQINSSTYQSVDEFTIKLKDLQKSFFNRAGARNYLLTADQKKGLKRQPVRVTDVEKLDPKDAPGVRATHDLIAREANLGQLEVEFFDPKPGDWVAQTGPTLRKKPSDEFGVLNVGQNRWQSLIRTSVKSPLRKQAFFHEMTHVDDVTFNGRMLAGSFAAEELVDLYILHEQILADPQIGRSYSDAKRTFDSAYWNRQDEIFDTGNLEAKGLGDIAVSKLLSRVVQRVSPASPTNMFVNGLPAAGVAESGGKLLISPSAGDPKLIGDLEAVIANGDFEARTANKPYANFTSMIDSNIDAMRQACQKYPNSKIGQIVEIVYKHRSEVGSEQILNRSSKVIDWWFHFEDVCQFLMSRGVFMQDSDVMSLFDGDMRLKIQQTIAERFKFNDLEYFAELMSFARLTASGWTEKNMPVLAKYLASFQASS